MKKISHWEGSRGRAMISQDPSPSSIPAHKWQGEEQSEGIHTQKYGTPGPGYLLWEDEQLIVLVFEDEWNFTLEKVGESWGAETPIICGGRACLINPSENQHEGTVSKCYLHGKYSRGVAVWGNSPEDKGQTDDSFSAFPQSSGPDAHRIRLWSSPPALTAQPQCSSVHLLRPAHSAQL